MAGLRHLAFRRLICWPLSAADTEIRCTSCSTSLKAAWIWLGRLPLAVSSALKRSMRSCRLVMALTMALDEDSTWPASALTASATTAKPRPASPACLASTAALNATSRVCREILVISAAASDTWASVDAMPTTSSPTTPRAPLARCTAAALCAVAVAMAACA
jgi:hypothetical protein